MGPQTRRRRLGHALLVAAACGPALWIGGALPEVVPVFCLVVGAWFLVRAPKTVPAAAMLGVLAVGVCILHWLPSATLRQWLVPDVAMRVDQLLAGTSAEIWPSASVVPGETGLEAARLLGLTVLFVLSAQVSWRRAASIVVVLASAVALLGFVHQLAETQAIAGVYVPTEVAGPRPSLLTTFVNPNHQASLFMLGIACAVATVVDRCAASGTERDASDRNRDHIYAAVAAIAVLVPALLASLSRGAILTVIVMAPVAALVAWPRSSGDEPAQRWLRQNTAAKLGVGGALVAAAVAVAYDGAWAELRTLAEFDTPGTSAAVKVRLATEAAGLIAIDQPLGVGPGSFVDHFGTIDSAPSHVLYAHLESMPIAVLVEYGWLGGGLLLAGFALWLGHTAVAVSRRADRRASGVVLVGVVAVAVHNCLGFSLAQLGVAAPVAMVAGSLTASRWRVPESVRLGIVVALAGAAALAAWAVPHTVAHRPDADTAVLSGVHDGEVLLRTRPMDGRLHGLIARRAVTQAQHRRALRWAASAATLRPGAPDPWLMLSAAHAGLGDASRSDQAMRRALARLHAPPSPELVTWLLERYPTPAALAVVVPVDGGAWRLVAKAVATVAPLHADAIAASRIRFAPTDARALERRHREAMRAEMPALALHHARMWRAATPDGPHAHVAVSRALLAFVPPRVREAIDGLAPVVHDNALSAADRGVLEEELVRLLLRRGDERSRTKAEALAPTLVTRPANRVVQRRRERLIAPLRAAD